MNTRTANCVRAVLTASALLWSGMAKADVINIALDLSNSVPLVHDVTFAQRAAAYVSDRVKTLKIGDRVQMRMFGAYGDANNMRRLDLPISRKNRAPQVAMAIGKIVGSIPKLVRNGKLQSQGATNMIGFLEAESYLLNCEAEPTEIILISDAVESSSYVSGKDMWTGKGSLPTPREGLLRGCAMTILGIGQIAQGADPGMVQRLIAAWGQWSETAGISTYKPLPHF